MKLQAFLTLGLVGSEWSELRLDISVPGERARYSVVGRLSGPQIWPGRCREKKNVLSPLGIECCPSRPYSVYIPTWGRKCFDNELEAFEGVPDSSVIVDLRLQK
jgi:hypothetical protein